MTQKTKFMVYIIKKDVTLVTKAGSHLEQVKDFQYLASWVDESEKDFKTCLETMQQNANPLIISPTCLLKDQHLLCHRRKYITVWGRKMDNNKQIWGKTWWLLHQTADNGTWSKLERPSQQRRNLWQTSKSVRSSQRKNSTLLPTVQDDLIYQFLN